MPRITSYPTITPTTADLVILSDTSGNGNPTKTATAGSIAELAEFSFTKVSATTAQLSAANTTPITLVASPGVGKIVVPFKIVIAITYGTAVMTGNTNLVVLQNQSAGHLYEWDGALGVSSSQTQEMLITTTNMQRYANTSTVLATESGNPTPGASTATADIYTYYRTLTL